MVKPMQFGTYWLVLTVMRFAALREYKAASYVCKPWKEDDPVIICLVEGSVSEAAIGLIRDLESTC